MMSYRQVRRLVFLLSTFVIGLLPPAVVIGPLTVDAAASLKLIVPAFVDLGTNSIFTSIQANSQSVAFVVLRIYGSSGFSQDPDWVTQVQTLRDLGIGVLGWIDGTNTRTSTDLEIDYATWRSYYNMSGAFFDNMDYTAPSASFYRDAANAIRADAPSQSFIMCNIPGSQTPRDELYMSACNVTVVHRPTAAATTAWTWTPDTAATPFYYNYPSQRYAIIASGMANRTSVRTILQLARTQNAYYVYATHATGANPFAVISTHFTTVLVPEIAPRVKGTYNYRLGTTVPMMSTSLGNVNFATAMTPDALPFSTYYSNVIQSTFKQNEVFNFTRIMNVNTVSLRNVTDLIALGGSSVTDVRNFIKALHNSGAVKVVEAIIPLNGDSSVLNPILNIIVNYNNNTATADDERLDGVFFDVDASANSPTSEGDLVNAVTFLRSQFPRYNTNLLNGVGLLITLRCGSLLASCTSTVLNTALPSSDYFMMLPASFSKNTPSGAVDDLAAATAFYYSRVTQVNSLIWPATAQSATLSTGGLYVDGLRSQLSADMSLALTTARLTTLHNNSLYFPYAVGNFAGVQWDDYVFARDATFSLFTTLSTTTLTQTPTSTASATNTSTATPTATSTISTTTITDGNGTTSAASTNAGVPETTPASPSDIPTLIPPPTPPPETTNMSAPATTTPPTKSGVQSQHVVTLTGTGWRQVLATAAKGAIEAEVGDDVASMLQLPASFVKVTSLAVGSLIAKFTVDHPAANTVASGPAYSDFVNKRLTAPVGSTPAFAKTTETYRQTSGVQDSPAVADSVMASDNTPPCALTCSTAALIAVPVVVVVLIVAGIVGVVCYRKAQPTEKVAVVAKNDVPPTALVGGEDVGGGGLDAVNHEPTEYADEQRRYYEAREEAFGGVEPVRTSESPTRSLFDASGRPASADYEPPPVEPRDHGHSDRGGGHASTTRHRGYSHRTSGGGQHRSSHYEVDVDDDYPR